AQTERLFGYRRAELIGASAEVLVPDRVRGQHPAFRAEYFLNPRARPMGQGKELFGRRKDSTEFPVEVSLSPIQTESGRLVSAAIRDVTMRKQVEAELAEKNRLLLQSERLAAIGETVAGLAHESRNSLQRSQACLDMLMHRLPTDSRERELAERI